MHMKEDIKMFLYFFVLAISTITLFLGLNNQRDINYVRSQMSSALSAKQSSMMRNQQMPMMGTETNTGGSDYMPSAQ